MLKTAILALTAASAMTIAANAQTTPNNPIHGAVQGTAEGTQQVGQGAVQGAGQAGSGIVRGTGTVVQGVTTSPGAAVTGAAKGTGQAAVGVAQGATTVTKKTGKGIWCVVTLGYGC